MKKRLLAACCAAAFLVTGGMVAAGETMEDIRNLTYSVMNERGLQGVDHGIVADSLLKTSYHLANSDAMNELDDAYQAGNLPDRDTYIASLLSDTMDSYSALLNLKNKQGESYALYQYFNGSDYAGALDAVTDTARNFNRAITNRAYNIGHLMDADGGLAYDECGNILTSTAGYTSRLWAGYTGQWANNTGRDWDRGYKYSAHGVNVGFDKVTSSGVGFGAAFGYSRGNYDNKARLWGEDSKIDNYSFGLFASYNHNSGWFSTLSGSYTYSKYKMHNGFVNDGSFDDPEYLEDFGSQKGYGYDRADFHGGTWSAGWKTGFDWKPCFLSERFTLTPTIGVNYYSAKTNRFDSTYRRDMKYSRHDIEAPIEITAKYDFNVGCDSTFSLMGTAGYAYNFNNKGTKIDSFTIGDHPAFRKHISLGDTRMPKPGHSSWNVGAGAQYRYRRFDVGVNYEYYGRKDYNGHSLNANLGVNF